MTDQPSTAQPQTAMGHETPPPGPESSSRNESPWIRHRNWARDHNILTEHGWREGYVVFKPSRWMTRFFFEHLLPLNSALTRLEANSFQLLGISEPFVQRARHVFQQLADLRVTCRILAREAERLARGRLGKAEHRHQPDTSAPAIETELEALQALSLAEQRARKDVIQHRTPGA